MCGIAGLFYFDGTTPDEKLLHRIADSMRKRGPDGEGFFVSESAALIHRRLAVIDLCTGEQPIFNEDSSAVCTVNGEIYNFKELRSGLEKKGHIFRSQSDCETVIHLYEEYGKDFVRHLDGMFACAVYDVKKKKLFLARDRAGEKPLFYFRKENVFAFASELNALKKHPAFPEELDFASLYEYLSYSCVPAPKTIFAGVRKLPPAHLLEISLDSPGEKLSRYWSPDDLAKTHFSEEEAREHLRELLFSSVKKMLVSDVPLGVFLSGGLDSAIAAGLASRIRGDALNCFSIGFPDRAYDESLQAKATAEWIGKRAERPVKFHLKTVDPEDFSLVRDMALYAGEPFADSSILPTALLCRFAREHVTVAIGGDGADELFGGYERYRAMMMLERLSLFPRSLFSFASSLLPSSGGERSFAGRVRRFLTAASFRTDEQYDFLTSACTADFKHALLKIVPPLLDEKKDLLSAYEGTLEEKLMRLDFDTYLSTDILMKTDLASMSNSLELRSPFLERKIIEFAFSLPSAWKICGKVRKKILGEAFRGIYPDGLEFARKRGFGVPVSAWFRGAWKEELSSRLLDPVFSDGLFRRETLEKLLSSHFSGKSDHGKILYTLLILAIFMEEK